MKDREGFQEEVHYSGVSWGCEDEQIGCGGVRQEKLHVHGGEAGEKRNKEGPVWRGTCEKTGSRAL